ncbi:hypothetical protein, partial [Thomasclavelia cocleata]|uniref:hypothetical protein n=1 Tax=Thomasclavelia cocleata TaxID=69824 RepID=UPI00256F50B7
DRITILNKQKPLEFKNIKIYYKNRYLDKPLTELFEYLIRNYDSSNNSNFNFNKYFNLDIDSFEVEKPKEYKE